jgi:tRNA pseudouridine13 synthase
VNYFGDQRFGSARHGRGLLAKHLIRGEFEDALWLAIATWARKDSRRQKEFKRAVAEKWKQWPDLVAALPRCPERRAIEHLASAPDDYCGAFAALPYGFQELSVHAYQSYMWNSIARRLAADQCTGPIMAVHDPFGEMQFPAATAVPPALANLDLPILGRDSPLLEPWRAAAEAVLAQEGVTTGMLRIPGLRRPHFGASQRRLFATASNFSLSPPEPDSPPAAAHARRPPRLARTLIFDLPRGAYATVLLRALGQ